MTISPAFEDSLTFVLRWEGGEVNDPHDPGGRTKFGISTRAHPDVDLDNLTREGAARIYHDHYWFPLHADEMPWPISLIVFDGAVQHGPMTAVRMLQRALGVHADGQVGDLTLGALWKHPNLRGLASELCVLRAIYYASLDRVFLHGWYRRLFDLHKEALCH
jgi:lysozyme family protein